VDRWYHIAIVRHKGETNLYKDGISVGDFEDDSNYISCGYTIGSKFTASTRSIDGYIDGFRVTKEKSSWGGRYIGEFTPPKAEFPSGKHPAYSKIDNQKNLFKSISGVSGIQVVSDDQHVYISGAAGGGGSDLIVVDETTTLSTAAKKLTFVGAGVSATEPTADEITVTVAGGVVNWKTPPPVHKNSAGTEGEISFDHAYYYICIRENEWRRVAISEW